MPEAMTSTTPAMPSFASSIAIATPVSMQSHRPARPSSSASTSELGKLRMLMRSVACVAGAVAGASAMRANVNARTEAPKAYETP